MKVIYDTCLYIDLLREGKRLDLFQDRSHVRYLSPVVIMELNAGCRSSKQQSILDKLFDPYSKAGRILKLETNHFYNSGKVLAKLRAYKPSLLVNDVLIALGAYSIGGCVFTSNKDDFKVIRQHVPFKVEFLRN